MNRVFILLPAIPVYFAAMLFLLFTKLKNDKVQAFEQARLQKAVNYATDAATAEMLGVGHLQMDREDPNKEIADPQSALDTFCDVLAVNYDIPANDESRALIQGRYLPVFAVAAYDGVYVAEPLAKGSALLAFSPKIPYTYVAENGDYYALNFSFEQCVTYSGGKLRRFTNPLGREKTLRVINTKISEMMMFALDKAYKGGFAHTLYVPQEMTELQRTNEVKTISVLAFMDGVDLSRAKGLTSFSIGGARVKDARRVVGYARGAAKYYCYADLLPVAEAAVAIEVFNSPEEAAQAGYFYDALYMK